MEIIQTYRRICENLDDGAKEKVLRSARVLIGRAAIMNTGSSVMMAAELSLRPNFPLLAPEQSKALMFYVVGLAAASEFNLGIFNAVCGSQNLQCMNLASKMPEGSPAHEALSMILQIDVDATDEIIRAIK